MSIKKFGAKDINLISPTGTPNITSPGELNLNAQTVAISTDLSIGGEITSDLDVVGVATFQDTAVFNGSVGIGTSLPQGALEVIGNVRISGILTATIPNLIVSDDDRNTFIGEDTGGTYDASTGTACYNVAIGYNAAECLTEGQNNVFLGRYAGHKNSCGTDNIFMGCGAGYENTCGNYNFFGGYQAGRNAPRAHCSVHIGYFAGNKSCGDSNIFIGSFSGQCTTGNGSSCGNGNIFLGKNSGCANVTGSHNIILGEEAGRCNVDNHNIILGHLAGCCNTGGDNIIIGCQAARGKIGGNGNIFLGPGAGKDVSGGATNVVIGKDVNPAVLSGSTQLAIGAPTGTWINGDSSFNVGIGTDDSSSKLQVHGTLGISASGEQESVFPGGRTKLTSSGSGFIINHNDSSDTIFQNQGGERVRIDSSGNVGIKETNPQTKLHITDSNNGNQGTENDNMTLRFEDTDPTSGTGGQRMGTIEWYGNDVTTYAAGVRASINAFGSGGNQVPSLHYRSDRQDFYTGNSGLSSTTSLTMSLTGSGNAYFTGKVGINTNTVGSGATDALLVNGHVIPSFHNAYDIGSDAVRWRNIYTTDLKLSNEGKTNDVDGTWGNYTIQEGEDDLYLINHRNGKKYKFVIQEVN